MTTNESGASPTTDIDAAVAGFEQALGSVGVKIDPRTAKWAEIETGVSRLLGGPFSRETPEHASLAFLVGATLAVRVRRDLGAFWFSNRDVTLGAALGFAEALLVISPFDSAVDALSHAALASFDRLPDELRQALGRSRLQTPEGAPRLGPADYQHVFDPGLIGFSCLDPMGMEAAFTATAEATIRELKRGFSLLPADVSKDARKSLRRQLVGSLEQLEGGKPLADAASRAPQLVELVVFCQAETASSAIAPEELWESVALPLLHVGAPESFPDLDDEEKAAFSQGIDPLLVYVEALPYATSAADEDGFLGVFPPEGLAPMDNRLAKNPTARMVRVPLGSIEPVLSRFDPAALRDGLARFTAHAEKAAGGPAARPARDQPPLIDVALTLLESLAEVVRHAKDKDGILCLRRMTGAEAASEQVFLPLRQALRAPRIVLA